MTAADPERLLADALRAQAARTPLPSTRDVVGEPPTTRTPAAPSPGSGSGPNATVHTTDPDDAATADQDLPPRVWWVLVLALMLGLAAGSLVGFLTLIR
ncbi:hypothetical protein V5P93_007265 [Actinokineospora auranticolor]|uniref:Uncharacterized protein n=1 Tax=Actinokineospora auranticolor TaxID=155976 RepID=A0A2S6GRT1_9PSEU|nr:hypothetical protein [Actinokineospora auranticolor]PPK67920.1 hypothetical protein CLV40_106151 [Actinokineospora auranticolor]